MYPTQERIKELQWLFGVHSGQFWGQYRFKNLNWYLVKDGKLASKGEGEWFCYGDIRDEDVPRLQGVLQEGERLVLGWKDMGPDTYTDEIRGFGGGIWMIIRHDRIVYDCRRDHPQKFEDQKFGDEG